MTKDIMKNFREQFEQDYIVTSSKSKRADCRHSLRQQASNLICTTLFKKVSEIIRVKTDSW